jgi:hypothetical protein
MSLLPESHSRVQRGICLLARELKPPPCELFSQQALMQLQALQGRPQLWQFWVRLLTWTWLRVLKGFRGWILAWQREKGRGAKRCSGSQEKGKKEEGEKFSK